MNEASNRPFWLPKLPMNIQLFADGADGNGGAEGGSNGGGEQSNGDDAQNAQGGSEQPKTYTEEELQAEVNRVVQQRLERQKRDEKKRIDAARAEGRSEAEKLAQMTAEQRAEHDRQEAERAAQERENALAAREAEINRRELRATAIDTLAKRGLPTSLEAVLVYKDADSCNASIDVLEKTFRAAVQQGVEERLKASGVNIRSGNTPDYARMSDAEYYAARYKSKKG